MFNELYDRWKLKYVLIVAALGFGLYFLTQLIIAHTSKNYGFYGTHYDFVAFYTAAKAFMTSGIHDVFNAAYMSDLQRQIVPHPIGAIGYMPFLNPPFVAVFISPLAWLGINVARIAMLVLNLSMLGFVLTKLTAGIARRQRLIIATLLLMTLPVYQTLVQGQLSMFVLLGATLSYIWFKDKKFLSGAALVLTWTITQFGVFVLAALIYKREWKMVKGMLAATAAVLLVTLPFTGVTIYFDYVRLLMTVTSNHFADMYTPTIYEWRGALELSDGMNGFFTAILGKRLHTLSNVLYVASGIALVGYLVIKVRSAGQKLRHMQGYYMFIAAILVALLIDPHLFAQDIIVIYVILPVLYKLYKGRELRVTLLFVALCNLVYIDQYIRFHLFTFVIFMGAIYSIKMALTPKKIPLNTKNI